MSKDDFFRNQSVLSFYFFGYHFTPEAVARFDEPSPRVRIEQGQTQFSSRLPKTKGGSPTYKECYWELENFPEGVAQTLFFGRENLKHNPRAHAYLKKRGISLKTALSLGLGWADEAPFAEKISDKPEKWQNYKCEAVISTMRNAYNEVVGFEWRGLTRDFERNGTKTSGSKHPWNLSFLEQTSQPVIFTEGVFDAASFIELGYQALPLFSAGNWAKVAEFCAGKQIAAPLIFALDNDDAGRNAFKAVLAQFSDKQFAGVRVYAEPFFRDGIDWTGIKDANDLLLQNSELLKLRTDEIFSQCADFQHFIKVDFSTVNPKDEPARAFPTVDTLTENFRRAIQRNKQLGAMPTFLPELNEALGGGFKGGRLYVLAAQPALGKTALALQIANHVAQSGRKVLFFSLELSKTELMSRAASRISFELAGEGKIAKGYSFDEIFSGEITDSDFEKIQNVANARFWQNTIIEGGSFDETQIDSIRGVVAAYAEQNPIPPFVVVDYFQIISTDDDRQTDKQRAEEAVTKLKKIAVDFECPLFVISAIARQNYKAELGMDAAKESGKIEYTADVQIGLSISLNDDLQIGGAGADDEPEPNGEKPNGKGKQNKAKPPKHAAVPKTKEFIQRKIDEYFDATRSGGAGELELKIIKNRAKGAGQKIRVYFNPLKNLFTPTEPERQAKTAGFLPSDESPL